MIKYFLIEIGEVKMKKLKMKKLISLLLTLTMILALTACGAKETGKSQDESDLNYVKSKGKLIIGYTNYAPMIIQMKTAFLPALTQSWQF